MNTSVYLFGEFNNGYSQYPDDYTSSIFQNFYTNAKATTQIAIYRDGNLMYYGYIRKLQEDRYIGLCVLLNGLMLNRIDGLFSLFENTISNLVCNGQLIHYDEQGELVTSVEQLYLNQEEIELIATSLRIGFDRLESRCSSIPAVSYGISKDSCKDFVVDNDHDEIIKSSYTNGYTYIYKSNGFNTAQLNSYKGVLRKLYKEKQELQAKNDTLEKELAETIRQKKQFKFVFFLLLLILGCGIGIFSLRDNLNNTRDALSNANAYISMQNDSLSAKNIQISDLYVANQQLNTKWQTEKYKRIELEYKRDTLQNELDTLKKKITDRQPLVVKRTYFEFSTGYLTIEYFGMVEGSIDVQLKAFSEKGELYKNSTSFYVYEGDNKVRIYLTRSLDSSTWYSFEILKGNTILGGGRH